MDLFFIIGLIALCFIAIGFIGYKRITENIIKTQEREIAQLKRDKAYLERNRVKVENITIDRAPDNIPSFDPF